LPALFTGFSPAHDNKRPWRKEFSPLKKAAAALKKEAEKRDIV